MTVYNDNTIPRFANGKTWSLEHLNGFYLTHHEVDPGRLLYEAARWFDKNHSASPLSLTFSTGHDSEGYYESLAVVYE